MIAIVEHVEVALRKTPIELHLDDAFSRVYHRLRNGQYHRAAITRLAQANEARCLAITLDNACLAIRLQAGDESFRTSLALRIQSVVERAELEHRDASAAAEEFAAYGGDDNASVAGELRAAIGRVLDNREQLLVVYLVVDFGRRELAREICDRVQVPAGVWLVKNACYSEI